jgi:hypothetical protein
MDSEKLAQAAPVNGASNATDFQPPTQNPQTDPVNVQQQNGLQNITNPQEFLNERQNARISVATEPAPAQAAVEPTNDAIGIVLLLIIAVLAAILVYKIFNKHPDEPLPAVVEEPSTEPDKVAEEPKTVEPKPATKTKKTEAKRRASKKAKRRRK